MSPTIKRQNKTPERNAPCPCGSGKKYKQCCLVQRQDATSQQAAKAAQAAQWLQQGLEQHRAGQLEAAKTQYEKVLGILPEQVDAWHLLGVLSQSCGQLPRAIECLSRALQLQPDNAEHALSLGLAWQAAGQPTQAEAAYRHALTVDPDHVAARNNLGNALKDLGRFEEAVDSYRAALQRLSEPMIHYNLANVLFTLNRVDEAIGHFNEALVLNPAYVEAWGNLGSAWRSKGKMTEAIDCYRRALALRADFAEAHNNLGNIYRDQDDWAQALESYRTAVALRPTDAGMQNNLAHAFKALGQIDAAASAYRAVLQIAPAHTEAAVNLAGMLQQSDAAQAIFWYRHALEHNPYSLEAWNNLGCVLHTAGDMEAALATYQRGLEYGSQSAELWYNLGNAQQQMWLIAPAVDSYRRALALKPDYLEAHNNLGNACKALERYDEAEVAYLQALALAPEQAQTHCNLAILYSTQKRYPEAEVAYRRALMLDPDMVVAARNLAAVLAQDGRMDEARQFMDRAYRGKCWFHETRYGVARTVLILLGTEKGNVPFSHLLPPQRNNTVEWVIDYAQDIDNPELPAYDIVFNALGEPDMASAASERAARFVACCDKPVLNPPDAIALTARDRMIEQYAGVPDVLVPPVWRVTADSALPDDLGFPVLLRPAGAHGGEGLVQIEQDAVLRQHLLAGSGQEFFLAPFYDYRSADGYFRKYRIIFIDGEPYPYHQAISSHWMVHYDTAGMLEDWKLAEEARFLEHPDQVLGKDIMQAVRAIGQRLGLAFGGADFGLLPDGRLLLFEANATMLVHPEKDNPLLAFKNPYVERIYAAFDAALTRRLADRRFL